MARVLMVVTSTARMPGGTPTGLWLEEFAVPFALLREAGHEVVVASPQGGAAPIDPRSEGDLEQHPEWRSASEALQRTTPLDQIDPGDYAAVFIPGGHGTMFDFPDHPALGRLLRALHDAGKPVAAVCHGPAAFVGATDAQGRPLVEGRTLTAFSNEEEHAARLDGEVPFLLSTRLAQLGATVQNGANFESNTRRDGWLITGQNPQSSARTAELLVDALAGRNWDKGD